MYEVYEVSVHTSHIDEVEKRIFHGLVKHLNRETEDLLRAYTSSIFYMRSKITIVHLLSRNNGNNTKGPIYKIKQQ